MSLRLRALCASFSLLALASACRPSDFDDVARLRSDDAAVEVAPDAQVSERDAGGALADAGCVVAPRGGRPLRVRAVPTELARLTHPAGVSSRIPGPSGVVAGRRVFTFTTTHSGVARPADVPGNFPTSALSGDDRPWLRPSASGAPWALQEIFAPGGAPRTLLRLREGEERVTNLAATSLLPADGDDARAVLFVQANVFLSPASAIWLADLAAPTGEAVRRAQPLFVAPDPMFSLGALRTPTDLKVYACTRKEQTFGSRCVIARAPRDRIDDRAAYQVYGKDADGAPAWLSDLTRGEPVLEDVSEDLSVSWNAHLGSFLAVSSAPLAAAVHLRTAAAMEGPWSAPVVVALPPSRVFVPLRAREQPGLAQDCERRLIITYWSPTAAPDPDSLPSEGDVVIAAIELE